MVLYASLHILGGRGNTNYMTHLLFFVLTLQAADLPLLQKFQGTWDGTKSYQATFHQTVKAKQMGTEDKSEGVIYVQKPDQLRWESATDNSIQILSHNTLTSIQINAKRGTRTVNILKNVNKTVDSKALSFLAGRAKFSDLYRAKLVSETPKVARLKLTPIKGKAEETYIAEINKESYFLTSLTTEAPDSIVIMEFADIKPNLKLDETLFEFKPEAKDVIRNQ